MAIPSVRPHGAGAGTQLAHEPEGAPIENQGLGWSSAYKTGIAGDAITSGLEVTWTSTPGNGATASLSTSSKYEWELTKSPGGANQWKRKGDAGANTVPDAHDPSKKHQPGMLTTDIALRVDPIYEELARDFYANLQTSSL